MKKFTALMLALVMALSLAACGGNTGGSEKPSGGNKQPSNDEVYTVSLQFTFPESAAGPVEAVLKEMEEASNGRLKFEVYYSFSMISNADVVDALQDGTLDIAGLMPTEYSIFNLCGRLSTMPMLGWESFESAAKIYMSMIYNNEAMLAEFTDNQLIPWGGTMCPGYQMYFAKDVTKTDPSLFSGLTIMNDNPEMQAFIAAQGGAVAASFPPDYYSNLSNGVAEGLVQHPNCVNAFGCMELVKTAVNFGEGGFYCGPLVYCISESFWNKLPEDLQALFGEYSDDICKAGVASDYGQLEVSLPALEASGAKVITLNESQMAEWQAAFQPILDSALDTIAKANPAVYDTFDQLTEMIANYDAASFKVGTNNFGYEVEW